MKTKVVVSVTMLFLTAGCASESSPSFPSLSSISSASCWWVQSDTLESVWYYLEKEKAQKIGFATKSRIVDPPHYLVEITEPERVKIIMDLLRKAAKESAEREMRGENWTGTIILSGMSQMIIITDQHKYAIFVSWDEKKIYGMEWVSYELREKLREWGLP
ncbi:MAG: hypothetical protein ACYS1A_08955 [Planctomycetota bacterium]|jgi:hypothetical protein